MKIIKGNLITLALQDEFDVIVHGCNCFCNMGAGIAKEIKHVFPEAYGKDCKTIKGDRNKLGKLSFVETNNNKKEKLIVINAYTQFGFWKENGNSPVDYNAIRSCFREIKKMFSGKRIAYPAIGAGLAGGDWNIISEIIKEELKEENHTFVVFNR